MHLMRPRAALFSPVHQTTSQYHLPEIGPNLADPAHRGGVAERLAEAAGPKTIAVDLALLTDADELLRDRELSRLQTAKKHEANPRYLLPTVPGIGTILSLVLLDEIHDRARFPRVQDVVADGRLVTWAKASAGKRWGTSGKPLGHAPLQGAFSEAAAWCLRNHPPGHTSLVRWEKKPDQGNALTRLAPTLARAVSSMLKRHTAWERDRCRRTEESRAGEPEV
jgi:hypothetical protein